MALTQNAFGNKRAGEGVRISDAVVLPATVKRRNGDNKNRDLCCYRSISLRLGREKEVGKPKIVIFS